MPRRLPIYFGSGLFIAGAICFFPIALSALPTISFKAHHVWLLGIAGVMMLVGGLTALGFRPTQVEWLGVKFTLAGVDQPALRPIAPIEIAQRVLPKEEVDRKRSYAETKHVPGGQFRDFNMLRDLGDRPNLDIMPHSNPMVPMYLLDKHFKVLDWNDAFSLAFDRTMEGRRNMNALEWVYFLENFQEVVDHGERVFSGEGPFPAIDVEILKYKSIRYKMINAKKRAYQIPDDDGRYAGWLVILELSFEDDQAAYQYQSDLIEVLRKNLIWTEYAFSYDAVLNNSIVYPKLIETMLGESGGLVPIGAKARVLDLGAGTGNLTERLAEPSQERVVFAIENNRAMLDRLRYRCRDYLRDDDRGPGVLAVKQDIVHLYGLNDNYFDVAIMNNTLYTLDDPLKCLKESRRVLKPGGEIRISGPKRDTNLDTLFRRIRRELTSSRKLESLSEDLAHVEYINKFMLGPMLYRWSLAEVKEMVLEAGFSSIVFETERAYAGQAMIVAARK